MSVAELHDRTLMLELIQTVLALDNDHIDCSLSTIQVRCDYIQELEDEAIKRGIPFENYYPYDEYARASRMTCDFYPDECELCNALPKDCEEKGGINE